MESLRTTIADLLSALARIIVFMISGIILGLVTTVAYRLSLHPLSRVPGPKLAAVSNIWHAYHARNGHMTSLGKTLHQKYGPVVRVGPNEVWFDTEDAFRTIYGTGSGYNKSDFYLATSLTKPRVDWLLRPHFSDTLDLLSERDMQRYRLQRRLIGPVYQISNVLKHEPAVDAVIDRVLERLRGLKGAEVDLKEWMHIITVECLAAIVLTWSPGMLTQGSDWSSSLHSYHGWRRKSVFGLFPTMSVVSASSKTLAHAFANIWGVTFNTPEKFKAFFPYINRRVSRRANAALRPDPPKDTRSDLMADLIQLHRDKPAFTEDYLRRMAITNFGAGHETMAATLTSIFAMVASHADVQERVAHEILHTASPIIYTTATQLTYTQAAVKEAKRLHPVIGMSLPRTAPQAGLHLHGHFFPAGTTVGCNPVSLHRNTLICGDNPDEYRPDRWLDAEAAKRMERCSLGWGGGARTCPGRNLAEMVVAKIVPAVFGEFDVQVIMPEKSGETYFLAMLTGVKARFCTRSNTGSVE